MRRMFYELLIALASSGVRAQTAANLPALPPRPPWSAVVAVVDESNRPIAGANVEVWYYIQPSPGSTEASEKITGLTDTNGIFSASHEDTGSVDLRFRISKPGYYTSSAGRTLYEPGQFDENTVMASRNPKITVLLKKVGQPIPMYAKRLNTHVPVLDMPVGFDLMAGDWVAPYGKGASADILFMAHLDRHSEDNSDYKLTVSFPKSGDGIQEYHSPSGKFPGQASALRSPHEAPAEGYQREWVQADSRKPGKPMETNRNENRNYFFRVRTVLDERGNIKEALYGKIYGDFMRFTYYLNPTPNSRNLEFDPTKNLMKNLGPGENVIQP